MKSIFVLIKQIKNLLPYFALIAMYFFFVNIEARKDNDFKKTIEKGYKFPDNKSDLNHKKIRIRIPVIPYKQ